MSRSRVYRCVALSDAERSELRRRSRRDRDGASLARLRRAMEQELARVPEQGDAGRRSLERIGNRLRHVEAMEQLNAVAEEIDRLISLPTVRGPGRRSPEAGVSIKLALARTELELQSIERSARELSLEPPTIQKAKTLMGRAKTEARRGRADAARALLDRAAQDLDDADEQVLEALTAAECRARTVQVVVQALAEMGYSVHGPVIRVDETVVSASAADGRAADVSVGGATEITVESLFTDPASQVAEGHAEASEVCELAAMDQLSLAKAISSAADLTADRPVALERPTRGSRTAGRRRTGEQQTRRSIRRPT